MALDPFASRTQAAQGMADPETEESQDGSPAPNGDTPPGGQEVDPEKATAPDDSAAAPEAAPEDDEIDEESIAAKIADFEQLIKVPQWLMDVYDGFQFDRDYVSNDSLYKDDAETTRTNYILRNQYVLISQIFAKDPTISVNPQKMIGQYPPGLTEFGETVEIIAKRLADEANFKQILGGALQDVQTTGIAWLKVSMQQDIMKDPIGAFRHDDELDNIARLKAMLTQYQNGTIEEGSAEYADLIDLSDTVKKYLANSLQDDLKANPPAPVPNGQVDVMTGEPQFHPDPGDPRIAQMQDLQSTGQMASPGVLPEVPSFIGINIDGVQPEDMRMDWSITRPEDFYQSKWVAHRVFMLKSDVNMKWPSVLEDDDYNCAITTDSGKQRDTETPDEPQERWIRESPNLNHRYAVWEMWDKVTGRRYVWLQGTRKFLENEVPSPTWHLFYPFFPVVFNRLTGRFIPVSDVRMQMALQEEINTKRTHEREAQRAAYPRFVVAAGAFSEGEKERLEQALPYSVTELQKPEDVSKYFKELMTSDFKPELYDVTKAVRDLEIMAGIPQQAAGGTGNAQFATEAAIANQQMNVQADYRRSCVEQVIHDVYECIIEYALQQFPADSVKQIAGPQAVWPVLDREHLWRLLNLDVKPGTSGPPDQQKVLEKWLQFADLAQRFGLIVNGPAVFQQILDEMDMRIDIQQFILAAMPPGMAPPGAPGQPGQGGPPGPPPNPLNGPQTAQPPKPAAGGIGDGAGPSGGAPPMSQTGPRPPGGIPNRPPVPGLK